ncbi:MAG: 5-(carboxyamino)imidazole ribonucleotide synthase [Leptospiraceae bacterium]
MSQSRKPILPPSTIGILGGGQLGRMIAQEARRMGYGIIVLDPGTDCPASHLADEHMQADFSDAKAVQALSQKCDVLTFEFENVEPSVMQGLTSYPALEPLFISRNRLREKSLAQNLRIPTAPFIPVDSATELRQALRNTEIQKCAGAILKTCEGGYDGKGQWRLGLKELQAALDSRISDQEFVHLLDSALVSAFRSREDTLTTGNKIPTKDSATIKERTASSESRDSATAKTDQSVEYGHGLDATFVLEGMVDFTLEFSIVGTGFNDGSFHSFSAIENQHRNGILHKSYSICKMNQKAQTLAEEYARRLCNHFSYTGTFAVEFFLSNDEPVFNEMAPRPHNSGHLTLDANYSSQFEQHVRAICGLPSGDTDSICEAVMINLIGEDESELSGLEQALKIPGLRFHWYGKNDSRQGRKMGHITALGSTIESAEQKADQAYECLGWVRQ